MKKYILKVLIVITLLIGLSVNFQNYAYAAELDYENGHFEKVKNDINVFGNPVKLQDGRILITHENRNFIFDPKNNQFRKIENFKDNLVTYSPGLLLPSGKVLFIMHTGKLEPSWEFRNELYRPILDSFVGSKDEKEIDYRKYLHLPESEKAKVYMPYIEQNPELKRQYDELAILKKKSQYAQLFNPITEQFEYTGKTNFLYTNVKMLLLNNEQILIYGNNGKREFYNPQTELFSIVQDKVLNEKYYPLFVLQNGSILLKKDQKIIRYNPEQNELFESNEFLPAKTNHYIKLKNDTLIFSSNISTNSSKIYPLDFTEIYSYIPEVNKIENIGQLIIPRGSDYLVTLLPDEKILITGGTNFKKSGSFSGGAVYERRAEIFDIKTEKSKQLPSPYYIDGKTILLNDGRVLLYGISNAELYVPKNYLK